MNRLIVDTDIASYVFRNAPEPFEAFAEWDPCLSFMSVAELRAWALNSQWGGRRAGMLERFIRDFEVIHSDDDICSFWAEIRTASRAIGREMSAQDAWIAATAIALDAPLATNNRRDYEHIDSLQLLDL